MREEQDPGPEQLRDLSVLLYPGEKFACWSGNLSPTLLCKVWKEGLVCANGIEITTSRFGFRPG